MAKPRVPAHLRRDVWRLAAGCCEYCRSQARFAMQPFSVEHISPRSRGGDSSPDNLALSCQGCNNHKYNHTDAPDPATGCMAPLFHPRRQRWSDHLAWNEEATLIVGLSPTGRATVESLHLNRPEVVNLRRILAAAGEHPPAEPSGSGDQ
jgi:HNH endonuclease